MRTGPIAFFVMDSFFFLVQVSGSVCYLVWWGNDCLVVATLDGTVYLWNFGLGDIPKVSLLPVVP